MEIFENHLRKIRRIRAMEDDDSLSNFPSQFFFFGTFVIFFCDFFE